MLRAASLLRLMIRYVLMYDYVVDYLTQKRTHGAAASMKLCELTALPRALYLAAVTPPPLAILSSRVWLLARKER